ncbi:hypothetical protein HDU97_005194 [Phlyctochytrium planicorne]|nr:hypothetical protein HDU97_005194 [Phlyctochytrium planicorne]
MSDSQRNPTPPPKDISANTIVSSSSSTLEQLPAEVVPAPLPQAPVDAAVVGAADNLVEDEKPRGMIASTMKRVKDKKWTAVSYLSRQSMNSDLDGLCESERPVGKSKKKHSYKVKVQNQASENWRDLLRWRASVLPSVILPTLLLSVWSAIVCIFYMVKDVNFLSGRLPNSVLLITVLGIVMGLLLVFRTNTSYDRYWEGRRLWGVSLTQIRNLARLVWINVATKTEEDAVQKRGAMNLIIAFGCSIKHYLRMEHGHEFDDLGPFVAHLPEYSGDDASTQAGPRGSKNLPLDITFHLQAYISKCRRTDLIDIPTQGAMTTALSSLVDCLSGFERIRDSPIPLAYSIHLKQTLLLYLLSLPFQLVPGIFWGAVPAVTIAAFTLLGIEAIGGQIENPFGYDENDLPQDQYTDDIRDEVFALMKHCETEDKLKEKYDAGKWLEPFKDLSFSHLHEAAEKETREKSNVIVEVSSATPEPSVPAEKKKSSVGWLGIGGK